MRSPTLPGSSPGAAADGGPERVGSCGWLGGDGPSRGGPERVAADVHAGALRTSDGGTDDAPPSSSSSSSKAANPTRRRSATEYCSTLRFARGAT